MTTAITVCVVAASLLGLATGLRTLTPIAVLCWFAHLGRLPVQRTWAFWTAHTASAVIFSLLALGEYVGDKLPQTPNRISPAPLVARLVFGGLAAAVLAVANRISGIECLLFGLLGALLGAFGGFMIRRDLVQRIGSRDWPVAVAEDLVALGGSTFVVLFALR